MLLMLLMGAEFTVPNADAAASGCIRTSWWCAPDPWPSTCPASDVSSAGGRSRKATSSSSAPDSSSAAPTSKRISSSSNRPATVLDPACSSPPRSRPFLPSSASIICFHHLLPSSASILPWRRALAGPPSMNHALRQSDNVAIQVDRIANICPVPFLFLFLFLFFFFFFLFFFFFFRLNASVDVVWWLHRLVCLLFVSC